MDYISSDMPIIKLCYIFFSLCHSSYGIVLMFYPYSSGLLHLYWENHTSARNEILEDMDEIERYYTATTIANSKKSKPVISFFLGFIFSVTYIFGKYSIFGTILDKMLHFQYIPKLITCYVSFRFSETKQWQMLSIRKSCLNCVAGIIISTYHGL